MHSLRPLSASTPNFQPPTTPRPPDVIILGRPGVMTRYYNLSSDRPSNQKLQGKPIARRPFSSGDPSTGAPFFFAAGRFQAVDFQVGVSAGLGATSNLTRPTEEAMPAGGDIASFKVG